MPATCTRHRRWALTGFLLLLPVLVAPPAVAHPFGPPLSATLDQQGPVLTMTWTGADDDWMVVGQHTGAFDEVAGTSTGAEVLAASPLVQNYLSERIKVAVPGGRSCEQQFESVSDVLADGARLTFTCPEGTTDVAVTLDVLTDVNAAYRTVLEVGDSDAQTLFTATNSTQEISLDEPGDNAAAGSFAVLGGVAAAVLAVVVSLWWLRRRQGEQ